MDRSENERINETRFGYLIPASDDYTIIKSDSHEDMITKVNEHLSDGWQLFSPLAFSEGFMYQAMTRSKLLAREIEVLNKLRMAGIQKDVLLDDDPSTVWKKV